MLYFLHRYDIYILGVLMTLFSTLTYFLFPGYFSNIEYSVVVITWSTLWVYSLTSGSRWTTFHEDFRLALEDALHECTPSDFEHVDYYDFLMPRVHETLLPRTIYNVRLPFEVEKFIRISNVTLDDTRLYLNFTIKYPKALCIKLRALGIRQVSAAITGRPNIELPVHKNSKVPKLKVSIYLGSFNPDTISASKVYCLRSLNDELAGQDTSIYPL